MVEIRLVLDNVRSAHNVGAILRTAAGLGVKRAYAVGRTPYPPRPHDQRLPHVAERAGRQIAKTALGAESWVELVPATESELIDQLKRLSITIVVLETGPDSRPLTDFRPPAKSALVLGHEIEGVSPGWRAAAEWQLAIPMSKAKSSFNVASAAAMALYHFRFGA